MGICNSWEIGHTTTLIHSLVIHAQIGLKLVLKLHNKLNKNTACRINPCISWYDFQTSKHWKKRLCYHTHHVWLKFALISSELLWKWLPSLNVVHNSFIGKIIISSLSNIFEYSTLSISKASERPTIQTQYMITAIYRFWPKEFIILFRNFSQKTKTYIQ